MFEFISHALLTTPSVEPTPEPPEPPEPEENDEEQDNDEQEIKQEFSDEDEEESAARTQHVLASADHLLEL